MGEGASYKVGGTPPKFLQCFVPTNCLVISVPNAVISVAGLFWSFAEKREAI